MVVGAGNAWLHGQPRAQPKRALKVICIEKMTKRPAASEQPLGAALRAPGGHRDRNVALLDDMYSQSVLALRAPNSSYAPTADCSGLRLLTSASMAELD